MQCCDIVESVRHQMREESHRTSSAVAWVLPFEMLLSALLAVIAHNSNPGWKKLAFHTAERAKARSLAESIAASAAREAEAQGFRFSGISVRPMDPREEIARADFTSVHDMLKREAGTAASESPGRA
jgi:hypothetical protein